MEIYFFPRDQKNSQNLFLMGLVGSGCALFASLLQIVILVQKPFMDKWKFKWIIVACQKDFNSRNWSGDPRWDGGQKIECIWHESCNQNCCFIFCVVVMIKWEMGVFFVGSSLNKSSNKRAPDAASLSSLINVTNTQQLSITHQQYKS